MDPVELNQGRNPDASAVAPTRELDHDWTMTAVACERSERRKSAVAGFLSIGETGFEPATARPPSRLITTVRGSIREPSCFCPGQGHRLEQNEELLADHSPDRM